MNMDTKQFVYFIIGEVDGYAAVRREFNSIFCQICQNLLKTLLVTF